uniref:methyl-accepting chemotaxis protein n=1 Tax=Castellaniella caeni TaxID=266123 RepID=UPI000C9FF631|nr:methyl-accepting chemotaxis protein [Castellaniella caeni]
MRKNLPVTQRDYDFPDHETLLSATDTKGRITYANAAFVRVSGFEYRELLGKAHNIVRHPDVPPEAYQDLWDTLKLGRSWTAILKNRRKDGDTYWVRANVTPVYHEGTLSGYVSVRTKPGADEIRATERVFQAYAQGRQKVRFHRGLLFATGWRRVGNGLRTLSLRQQLALTLGGLWGAWVLIVGQAGIAGTAWLTSSAVGLACILLAGHLLERRLIRPLHAIQRQAIQAASGQRVDDWRLTRLDEVASIQKALKQGSLNLRSFIDDVQDQLQGLRRTSADIAEGSQGLSQQTEAAARQLADTATDLDRLGLLTTDNTRHAQAAVQLAQASSQSATEAADVVHQAAARIEDMDTASQRIGDIVQTIDGIAFQTNILALNAAVEAARAGEHGRGFAVVAGEVRALAQRSATAAQEIANLIHDVVGIAQDGVARTREAAGAMQQVLEHNRQVGELVARIHTAGQEQADDLSRIQHTFTQLGNLTQGNAAMAEQSSMVAQSLDAQTHNLAQAAGVFREDRPRAPEAARRAGARLAQALRTQAPGPSPRLTAG